MNSTFQLDELKQLLVQRVGLRIPPDSHERFAGILKQRAAFSGYDSLYQYRTFLAGNNATAEWEELVRAFTSIETFFFRDHGQFDLLRMHLLPELIARHRRDKTLRLWSAGCASGEEAYSLAMLVDMLLPESSGWNVFILGTDIDSVAIAKAQLGHYGQWSFRMFPAALQQRYFHMDNNEWLLDERIRRMVTLRVGNLVGDAFPDPGSLLHDMDLILCRNVFLYFDPAVVPAIAAKFAATLVGEGYLMTAHTELIGHTVAGLESKLFTEGVVYQRQSLLTSKELPPSACAMAAAWSAPSLNIANVSVDPARDNLPIDQAIHISSQQRDRANALCASARIHADRGEYELADQICHEALIADPLAATPYFLLAQLAQLSGDFDLAREYLNKVVYLDHLCVAGYLELAALYERDGNIPHARILRHTALKIVRRMNSDEQVEQYERTAGELAQWLEQWEPPANNHGNADENNIKGVTT